MARQRLVGSDPLWLQAVIEEQTLDRLVGGVGVMAEQLRHLRDLMDRDNVDLRIMPTSTAVHAGPDGDDPANDPAAQPVIALPASVRPAFLAAACANAPHAIADAPAIIHHLDGSVTLAGSGVTLLFTAAEWGAFVAGVRDGEFFDVRAAVSRRCPGWRRCEYSCPPR